MSGGKRALIIEHDPTIHLGNLKPVLVDRGYKIKVVRPQTDGLPDTFGDVDLLIILGNDHGVYDNRDYIVREKEWLRQWLTDRKPTLGICFGAQILAHTLGGQVFKGESTVIGYRDIEPTPEGLASPVRHFAGVPALEWHGDTFTVPPHATRLAGSDDYANEAYAIDDWLLAVQFHPETTTAMYERWLTDGRESVTSVGLDPDVLRKDGQMRVDEMAEASRRMLTEWLDAAERNQ